MDQAVIHWMAQSEDVEERREAVDELRYNFADFPDKEQAWSDLLRLTQDEDLDVRIGAAGSLGAAFPYIPEKHREQAWSDMICLTQDEDYMMRVCANHSLGRASIFKATNAENEEDFRKELEKALGYFESSLKESDFSNPASFCLPFYRSFYTITFRKQDAEEEVKKYLAEAKSAVKGSKSKKKLLEAVENLSNALTETQKAMEMNLEGRKCELNAYRRYCDRAAELLETTEEKAPGATKLIRKGLPIIDERIKEIIAEIQEKAKVFCKQTQKTPFEDLGKEVNRVSQKLSKVRDAIGLDISVNSMLILLSSICHKMPEEEKGEVCELLKKAKEAEYIDDKINLSNIVLGKMSSQAYFRIVLEKFNANLEDFRYKLETRFNEIKGSIDKNNDLMSSLNKTMAYLNDLLDKSTKYDLKAQDFVRELSEEFSKKLKERDEKWFEKLKNELIKKEPVIEKELSSAPEIKSKWHQWIDYIKNKAEKETKEIVQKLPTEAVVLISAEKILEYGVPFLSSAISSPAALPALVTILYAMRGIVPKDK